MFTARKKHRILLPTRLEQNFSVEDFPYVQNWLSGLYIPDDILLHSRIHSSSLEHLNESFVRHLAAALCPCNAFKSHLAEFCLSLSRTQKWNPQLKWQWLISVCSPSPPPCQQTPPPPCKLGLLPLYITVKWNHFRFHDRGAGANQTDSKHS